MSEPPSGSEPKRSLLERLSALLQRAPEDRDQLLELLRESHERDLLDADALAMIEGILQVSELAARDMMVPRAQMDVIDIDQPVADCLPRIIATGHSRFPVIEGERDNIIGVLHVKDLLRLFSADPPGIRELLRPAAFIPESKQLNVLLRHLRSSDDDLAIVVDEYGGVAGLITIEDVLEQIVGDIEECADPADESVPILAVNQGPNGLRFHVRGIAEIAQVNRMLGTQLPDRADSIGALLNEHLGRVPRRGEQLTLDGVRFEVLRADSRQALMLMAEGPAGALGANGDNGPAH